MPIEPTFLYMKSRSRWAGHATFVFALILAISLGLSPLPSAATVMGFRKSLAKLIMFVLNFVFFLLGAVILGGGIWVAKNKKELLSKSIEMVKDAVKMTKDEVNSLDGLVTLAGFVPIGIGAYILVVSFCGCWGTVKESKCLLGIYALLVGLVLLAEIVTAIMVAVYKRQISSVAQEGIFKLQDKFFVTMSEIMAKRVTGTNFTVTLLLNYVQISLECCGAKTPGDIANSSSWLASDRNLQVRLGNTETSKQLLMPLSCCRVQPEMKESAQVPGFDLTGDLKGTFVDPNCPFSAVGNSGMNQQTCYTAVLNFINKYSAILMGIFFGIAPFELFCILVACYLIFAIEPKP